MSRLLILLFGVLLVSCGGVTVTPTETPSPSLSAAASAPAPSASAAMTSVEPAPGGDSAIYEPNSGAIVVAIEAGHGGCLDWGVPDPDERGEAFSEKEITLAIARALAAQLEAEGVSAVLIRDNDEALAGDLYPPLGCDGEPFRDVNGDGIAGFGPDVPEATRTRDELQARLDVANLVGADVLISLHVDSITDAVGTPMPIARTETFYTDETAWGIPHSERLAAEIQSGVLASMDAVAGYERQDRGTNAQNLYIVAPPLLEPTPDRDDPVRQPTRGAVMPAVLVEIGSITLPAEHELLLTEAGVDAAAAGLFDGLAAYFARRELAARIGLADAVIGAAPPAVDGDGPPFLAPPAPEGVLRLRVTNTGTADWPSGARLVAGWEVSDQPYLYAAPEILHPIGEPMPAMAPGESVEIDVQLAQAPGSERGLAWISLSVGNELMADHGSPALQLASQAP